MLMKDTSLSVSFLHYASIVLDSSLSEIHCIELDVKILPLLTYCSPKKKLVYNMVRAKSHLPLGSAVDDSYRSANSRFFAIGYLVHVPSRLAWLNDTAISKPKCVQHTRNQNK